MIIFPSDFYCTKAGFSCLFFFWRGGVGGSSVKYLDLCFFSSLFTKLIITTEYLLPGRRSLILRARFLFFSTKSWPMVWFHYNTDRNFIFLLKYRQLKVDLKTFTHEHFVTTRNRKFHLWIKLAYTETSYLRKNTHLRKDVVFLHFRLKESSENMICSWNGTIQKLTKIWSFLFFSGILVRLKFFFSCSVTYLCSDVDVNSVSLKNAW